MLEQNPRDLSALVLTAETLQRVEDRDRAIAAWRDVLRVDDSYSPALRALADHSRACGDVETARTYIERAIKTSQPRPISPRYFRLMTKIAHMLGLKTDIGAIAQRDGEDASDHEKEWRQEAATYLRSFDGVPPN